MRWRFATSTVTGKGHTDRGETGQDYHKAGTIRIGDDDFFIGLAADGAGSTTEGGRGAEIACETAYVGIVSALREAGGGGIPAITDQEIRTLIATCRDTVEAEAKRNEKHLKEYACTVLGSVAGNCGAIFFQIGDGAIVSRTGLEYRTIFWPEQGEYANTTFFLSDEQFLDHLYILRTESFPDEIALFTDGLQSLVLSFSDRTAHAGFFRPIFDALKKSPENSLSDFSAQLQNFLCRDEITTRSDDDKTLILAVRTEP